MKDFFIYLKKNKVFTIIISVLAVTVILETVLIGNLRDDYKNSLNSRYQKAFFDLSTALSNIDVSLSKALITNSPSHLSLISSEILKETQYARSCIGDLPVKDVDLNNFNKFLSQVGDYVLYLSLKASEKEFLTDEEKENLKKLSDYSDKLSRRVNEAENKFLSGEMNFDKIIMAKADNYNVNTKISDIEKEFENYPALIYDGPFSDHISSNSAKMLLKDAEITKETAMKRALSFLDIEGVTELEETEDASGDLETYGFYLNGYNDEKIFIDLTKKGGHIVSFSSFYEIKEDNISFDEAILKASNFLERKGFKDFFHSYYEKANGVITLTFFPKENNIIMYPDLVKVKVSADDGNIIGADFRNYIKNHHKRENLTPLIPEKEARSSLSKDLKISSSKLCIIPLYSGKEVLCYEFSGSFNNKNYLCYVNATNKTIEKMFIVLKDKNRLLTM